jgi:hypothetical protein
VAKAKELLKLNKVFLATTVGWGFILAFLALAENSRTCETLSGIMWFGLALGFVGPLADAVLESIQNCLYTNFGRPRVSEAAEEARFHERQLENPNEHNLHRMFNAPLRYEGIRWGFSPGLRKDDASGLDACGFCCKPSNTYSCCHGACGGLLLLVLETLVRLAGNMLLYWLFVLAGVGAYTTAKTGTLCNCLNITIGNTCSKFPILSFTQDLSHLFWAAIALTIFRVVFGFTYGNYQPTINELTIKKIDKANAEKEMAELEKRLSPEKRDDLKKAKAKGKGKEEEGSDPIELDEFGLVLETDVGQRVARQWGYSPLNRGPEQF